MSTAMAMPRNAATSFPNQPERAGAMSLLILKIRNRSLPASVSEVKELTRQNDHCREAELLGTENTCQCSVAHQRADLGYNQGAEVSSVSLSLCWSQGVAARAARKRRQYFSPRRNHDSQCSRDFRS